MSEVFSLKDLGLSILNIPDELKQNMMWAGSTYKILDVETGRRDKAPRNVYTGERISVTDPKGWVTFDEAVNSGYPAIGMRLTSEDPYVVIDLDKATSENDNKRARKVYDAFDSYTETSKSGNGVHIILKGSDAQGKRKSNVEVYSRERYIICTGEVIRDKPIIQDEATLQRLRDSLLSNENPDTLPVIQSRDEVETDDSVLRRMFGATNGESVKALFSRRPDASQDWSKLDSQLAQHICFYTKNHNQALRIFRKSALYRGNGPFKSGYERKDKYEENYLLRLTFARAWYLEEQREAERQQISDEEVKKLEEHLEKGAITPNKIIKNNRNGIPEPSEIVTYENFDEYVKKGVLPSISRPSGLIGDISDYIYNSSARPVDAISIAGALSLVSGISGRHYNINGSGLGLYIVLLAKTGRGKEAASSGVSFLLDAVSERIPAVSMFRGPSQIASGQGLIRNMSEAKSDDNIPSKLLILSEFGHTMSIITSRDANAADLRTRQVLLDMFSKNAWKSSVKETAYADSQNNTGEINSPNLCILGDTTPELFFDSIDLGIVKEGFLPRFMIIEYDGPRVKGNYNINRTPSSDLVDRLTTLVTQVIAMRDASQCLNINYADEQALQTLVDFDDYCDEMINKDQQDSELWNRAHLKALRLAGLLAVGDNIFNPTVSQENARQAVEYVLRDMLSYHIRFAKGSFGGGEQERESLLRSCLFEYFEGNADYESNNIPKEYLKYGAIPIRYIYDYLSRENCFAKTKRGARNEINNTIMSLIKQGDIIEMDFRDIRGRDRKVFMREDSSYTIGNMYYANMKLSGFEPKAKAKIIAVNQGEDDDKK